MNREAAIKVSRLLLERWEPVDAIAFPDDAQDAVIASAACNATGARQRESEPEQRAHVATGGDP